MRSRVEGARAVNGMIRQGLGKEKGAILGQLRNPGAVVEQVGTLTRPAMPRYSRRFGNDAIDCYSLHSGADPWLSSARSAGTG
ncbi:hypothetical protein SPHV1_280043 [Novosphingobium sp. KN65.2]|nr:hypothetical protein SPHV1_280043 [Novosphingobium sp. KN65.2]